MAENNDQKRTKTCKYCKTEIPADWSKLEVSFSPSVWADEKIPFVIENQ